MLKNIKFFLLVSALPLPWAGCQNNQEVFAAIRSARPYKPAMPREVTAKIIRQGRGGHFDPTLVDAFEEAEPALDALWLDMQVG